MRNLVPYVVSTLDTEFDSHFRLVHVSIEQETVFLLYRSGTELAVRVWSPGTSFQDVVQWPTTTGEIIGFQGNSLDNTALVVMQNGDVYSVILTDGVVMEVGSLETRIVACAHSPDLELVAVLLKTGKLLLLSADFDVIAEHQLSLDDIKLADAHVSVGWGKHETQFVGRGMKRDPTTQLEVETRVPSEVDVNTCSLSWRGDGEYLVVNTNLNNERVLFTFQRDGTLNSASEPADHLMGMVSWQPTGARIATCRDSSGADHHKNEVQFYELNGLKRGGFTAVNTDSLVDLLWSSDSSVLALVYSDYIDLYTTKNWHWYRKQRIELSCQHVVWHSEKPATLACVHNSMVSFYTFKFDIASNTDGLTAVIDGHKLLVTPLKLANVPPPMSLAEIDLDGQINAVTVGANKIAAALSTNLVVELELDNDTYELKIVKTLEMSCPVRQLTYTSDNTKLVGLSAANEIFTLDEPVGVQPVGSVGSPVGNGVIIEKPVSVLRGDYYLCNNELYSIETHNLVANFGRACMDFFATSSQSFGLSRTGDLIYGLTGSILASGVSSIKGSDTHLLFTTLNKLKFVHLGSIDPHVPSDDAGSEQTREIERGSYLVAVIPSAMSVVLQAARGNLETIYPRMLVLGVVRDCIRKLDYKSAFDKCKIHRLDMNILYDYNPQQFEENITLVLTQLKSESQIDLFMSALTDEDVSQTKYRDTSLGDVEIPDEVKNVPQKANKLLTKLLPHLTPACQITALCLATPPQLAQALDVATTTPLMKHLVFLSDANDLYRTALSVYKPRLALLVAQQAQMDPKEYVPFLRRLDEMEEFSRKFEIDVYLKRYALALQSLVSQPQVTDESILEFVERHELHSKALDLLPEGTAKNEVLNSQAEVYMQKSEYELAGLNFEILDMNTQALNAYILAQDWRKALSLTSIDDVKSVALQIAESCEADKQYIDAAHLFNYYLQDFSRAIECYCQCAEFDDATLVAQTHNLKPALEEQLRESFGTFSELVSDCKRQSKAQSQRLRDLRLQLKMDQLNFANANDEPVNDMDDALSVATETTNASVFTRYTDKSSTGTADTNTSRRTAKNQRRQERKKARGKKGSVYEEEYLISSTTRLMERLHSARSEIVKLLIALKRQRMTIYSSQLSTSFNELVTYLSENLDEVYTVDDNYLKRYDDHGNMVFKEKPERPADIEPLVM